MRVRASAAHHVLKVNPIAEMTTVPCVIFLIILGTGGRMVFFDCIAVIAVSGLSHGLPHWAYMLLTSIIFERSGC